MRMIELPFPVNVFSPWQTSPTWVSHINADLIIRIELVEDPPQKYKIVLRMKDLAPYVSDPLDWTFALSKANLLSESINAQAS